VDIVEQQRNSEQEQLQDARAQLIPEQRNHLDQIVEFRLREENAYDVKYEIALAHILYEGRSYVHERADIEGIITRAYNEAREREAKERWSSNLLASKAPPGLRESSVQNNSISAKARQKVTPPSNKIQDTHEVHLQDVLAVAREELSHKDKEEVGRNFTKKDLRR